MGRALAAGSAAVLFVMAVGAMLLGSFDRAAAMLALLGLAALSVALLLHLNDHPRS
jgi:hypothetical protein